MSNYDKYKERTPESTVFEIRRILSEAGITQIVRPTACADSGAISCRVSLYPLESLGQNGKGTDELYATASGYAELMERMQNMWLGQKRHAQELVERDGFYEFPDQRLMDIDELLEQGDPYLTHVFKNLVLLTHSQRRSIVEQFAREYYRRTDGMIPVVPYVDVMSDRVVWLPFAMITVFTMSNGMTAGNTMEEALVQGISEVYERYVQLRLLKGGLTPPEIPRDELRGYSFWSLVERIESSGRYRVSVRDCSLGEEYPVSCVIIQDLWRGTFGVKVGCHPSLAIAVERTLTESFQGKTLDVLSSSSCVGGRGTVNAYHNRINALKVGAGVYPPELLCGTPSWDYAPWERWHGLNNRDYLVRLLARAHEHGFRPLIRDSSHMGFCSFHVVIPGVSEVYPIIPIRLREFWTQLKVAESFDRFPNLTEEEEARMLAFMKFKKSTVEHDMGISYMRYFVGKEYEPNRIMAYLALKRHDYALAMRLFDYLSRLEQEYSREREILNALARYATLRMQGVDAQQAHAAIRYAYREEVASDVCWLTEDDSRVLMRAFPRVAQCFNCSTCALSGKDCEYHEAERLYERIKDAMAKSTVNVAAFRRSLKSLVDEALAHRGGLQEGLQND